MRPLKSDYNEWLTTFTVIALCQQKILKNYRFCWTSHFGPFLWFFYCVTTQNLIAKIFFNCLLFFSSRLFFSVKSFFKVFHLKLEIFLPRESDWDVKLVIAGFHENVWVCVSVCMCMSVCVWACACVCVFGK